MTYSLRQLSLIINAEVIGDPDYVIDAHFFDSRNIIHPKRGLFWGINGNREGSDFFEDAYKKGIRAFVSPKTPSLPKDASVLLVEDVTAALQKLSQYHLQNANITTIGITGSNGKTIVKEWLFQCLTSDFSMVRSPKSYNSQIGLPFSILQTSEENQLGIFEVGISQPDEMKRLEAIFQPDIGILTNVLEAHLENFSSYEELVKEKLLLFTHTQNLIYPIELENFIEKKPHGTYLSFGIDSGMVHLKQIQNTPEGKFKMVFGVEDAMISSVFSFGDEASIKNILCVIACLKILHYSDKDIEEKIGLLQPIEMRLEIKQGIDDSILIKDEFSLDIPSLEIALNVLKQQIKKRKKVILSDFAYQFKNEAFYRSVITLLTNAQLDEIIFIGTDFLPYQSEIHSRLLFFNDLDALIDHLDEIEITQSAVLIKGARKFGLERLSNLLQEQSHDAVLEVSLHNLIFNFNYFKGLLRSNTEIMAMVKANAYGLGLVEVSKTLQHYGVNYLGVAYADEGVLLRQNGLHLPIMVMNPEQNSFEKIVSHFLEPEIYSFRVLNKFIDVLKNKSISEPYPVHLKIDTGMHRLGFMKEDLPQLNQILIQNPYIRVQSVFSHLSSSDDLKEKEFTLSQIKEFEKDFAVLTNGWNTLPKRHILNTHGIINYPDFQYEMVRLGIGLYDHSFNANLKEVVRFKAVISQIKELNAGESISYNRKFITSRPMKIAILPVGYADGISRKLFPNQYKVRIHDQLCPVVGVVCMDMIMVDISHCSCEEGDEAVVFGDNPNLLNFAIASETITYNCLTSLSNRIKRIYFRE